MWGSIFITPAQLAPEDTPRLEDNAQRRRRRSKDHPALDADSFCLTGATQEQTGDLLDEQEVGDDQTIRHGFYA